MNTKKILLVLFLSAAFGFLQAQEAETVEDKLSSPEKSQVGMDAVLPMTNPNFIFVEAEDAVSTNFNNIPTLNYSASAYRTLQLNRYTPLYGGAPFFVEFVVFIQEDGEYQFWYGGTPPGPREDLNPSYSSPFRLKIDDQRAEPIYREDMDVVEPYTPAFYWNYVKTIPLSKGKHTIRMEVTEKRRMDGRFYFFLDAVFLLKRGAEATIAGQEPDVFPKDLNRRDQDNPFRSISDYEQRIKETPEEIYPYISIALVHSLMGDYNEALRNLNLAKNLDPSNPQVLLLTAKNRIWKGDIKEGLRVYKDLLNIDPTREAIWAEAGKVAAWTGEYDQSVNFYSRGLDFSPESINLNVNLGFTYMWTSREAQARQFFDAAKKVAFQNPETILSLGQIFEVNGYSQEARNTYKAAMEEYPAHVAFPLALAASLRRDGKNAEAQEVFDSIRTMYVMDEKLKELLTAEEIRQSIIEDQIQSIREQLAQDPDNLPLRESLVQTLFWNGLKEEAIREYMAIIANHGYRHISRMEQNQQDLLKLQDINSLLDYYWKKLSLVARDERTEISGKIAELNRLEKAKNSWLDRLAKAKAAGKIPQQPEEDPVEVYEDTLQLFEAYLTSAQKEYELYSVLPDLLSEHLLLVAEALLTEEEAQEKFDKIASAKAWTWDRETWIQELKSTAGDNRVLASYLLARTFQILGDYRMAENYLPTKEESVSFPALNYALFKEDSAEDDFIEALNWINNIPAADAYPHLKSLSGLLEANRKSVVLDGNTALSKAQSLMEQWSNLAGQSKEKLKQVQSSKRVLQEISLGQLERTYYGLEEETMLLRFELGDYYINIEDLPRATQQYNYVLAMDPWNINAKYKLGIVRQLYGDWHNSMTYFKQVYSSDPFYENVVRFHNLLANQNPDRLDATFMNLTDNANITSQLDLNYSSSLRSWLGMNIDYRYKTNKPYRLYEDVIPSIYAWHNLNLALPMQPYKSSMRITPKVGAYVYSQKYFQDHNEFFTPESYIEYLDSTDTPWISSMIDHPKVDPFASLRFEYTKDVNFLLEYGFSRYEETLSAQKDPFFTHTGIAQIAIPIGSFSSRTYGKVDYIFPRLDGETTIKWQALEEMLLNIHLLDAPWTNIGLMLNGVYEDASRQETAQFYTPDQVIVVKGGLTFGSWLPLRDSAVLGITGLVAGGPRFSAGDVVETALEGNLRLERTKNKGGVFLNLGATQTINAETPADQYWSLQISLGTNSQLTDLITP